MLVRWHLRQCLTDLGRGDVADQFHPGRAVKHESQPADGLLVGAHQRDELTGADVSRQRGRQAVMGDYLLMLGDSGLADAAELAGQPASEDRSDGDRLTMAQPEIRRTLERVTESVAVV